MSTEGSVKGVKCCCPSELTIGRTWWWRESVTKVPLLSQLLSWSVHCVSWKRPHPRASMNTASHLSPRTVQLCQPQVAMRRLYSVLLLAFTVLLLEHCLFSKASITTSNYEQILQWSTEYQAHTKTLKTLQKFHNSSAILHFIELTHNFTAEDLTNCKRVSLAALNFTVNAEAYRQFAKEADIAVRAAHFLTHLFSSNLHNNASLHHLISNKEFYWSLLFANLQTNFLIFGAGISFSNIFLNNFIPNLKHFSPYLYRNVRANNDSIKINLSTYKHFASDSASETFKSEWFWKLALPDYESTMSRWQETSMDSLSSVEGVWTSPYLDCGITKTWLTSYIVPFFKINTVNSVSQTTLV